MRAIDVMVRDVVTVRPDTEVAEAIKLLTEHDVSALPVLDQAGDLVGILSEADLIRRAEIGTETHRPWWSEAMTGASTLAEEFAKSHGKKVGEVMTYGVISVTEETPLAEIAARFERRRIKRVPVVKDGKLVGIVSRSNLIQALASVVGRIDQLDETDRQIRLELLSRLKSSTVDRFWRPQCHGWQPRRPSMGLVASEEERKALLALAEGVPGVSRVSDEMIPGY